MEKKNKVIYRLLGVFVVLLLVSLCLLGSTFARYTTSDSGSATVSIAEWNIGKEEVSASLTTLSPSSTEYNSSTHSSDPRSNTTTTAYQVITITNSGDVDANITDFAATVSGVTLKGDSSVISIGEINSSTTISGTNVTNTNSYTYSDVAGLFSMTLYTSSTISDDNKITDTSSQKLTASGSLKLYATITWTSADTSGNGDELDTFVGQYIESVQFTISWTGVQASELPTSE